MINEKIKQLAALKRKQKELQQLKKRSNPGMKPIIDKALVETGEAIDALQLELTEYQEFDV